MPDHHRARGDQPVDHRCAGGGGLVGERRAAGGGGQPGHVDVVLHRQPQAGQRQRRVAAATSAATSASGRRVIQVRHGRRRVDHDHPHRRRVEAVARVVHLRAVGDHDQDVALGPQVDPQPGGRDAVDDPEAAVGVDGHVHEPVDVRLQVALAQAVGAELVHEVLHAGVLGVGVVPVAEGVRLLGAGAADRVVAGARRARDRHHRVALGGHQHRARDEEDVALGDDRVRRAVALDRVVGVVEHAVDGLVALRGR